MFVSLSFRHLPSSFCVLPRCPLVLSCFCARAKRKALSAVIFAHFQHTPNHDVIVQSGDVTTLYPGSLLFLPCHPRRQGRKRRESLGTRLVMLYVLCHAVIMHCSRTYATVSKLCPYIPMLSSLNDVSVQKKEKKKEEKIVQE